jgi:hypothetical protein
MGINAVKNPKADFLRTKATNFAKRALFFASEAIHILFGKRL